MACMAKILFLNGRYDYMDSAALKKSDNEKKRSSFRNGPYLLSVPDGNGSCFTGPAPGA
jgi:hypothetical protein